MTQSLKSNERVRELNHQQKAARHLVISSGSSATQQRKQLTRRSFPVKHKTLLNAVTSAKVANLNKTQKQPNLKGIINKYLSGTIYSSNAELKGQHNKSRRQTFQHSRGQFLTDQLGSKSSERTRRSCVKLPA